MGELSYRGDPIGKVTEVIGPNPDGTMALDAEREAIAALVESATDAHDLHEIAARIRARKGQRQE